MTPSINRHQACLIALLRVVQIQTQFLESSGGEGGLSGSGATSQAVEARMLAFQRECEERARREVSLGTWGVRWPLKCASSDLYINLHRSS